MCSNGDRNTRRKEHLINISGASNRRSKSAADEIAKLASQLKALPAFHGEQGVNDGHIMIHESWISLIQVWALLKCVKTRVLLKCVEACIFGRWKQELQDLCSSI